jgi:hypothetical protein
VDSMDCDMISWYRTPVPKVWSTWGDCHYQQIIKSRKVICFEVVEVNPLLDTKGNKMAETAFEVLEQITSLLFTTWIAFFILFNKYNLKSKILGFFLSCSIEWYLISIFVIKIKTAVKSV